MATQAGKIRFTGRVGDLIGYYRNGVYCLRSMPLKVRQTAASKQAANNFGIASRNGKLVRQAFAAHLNGRKDNAWVNRLNKVLIGSGVEGMKGHRFNRHTGIENFLRNYTLDENNILHIPSQTICPLPQKITHLEVKLIATRIDFNSGQIIDTVVQSSLHDLCQPFEGLIFDANVKGKGTLIVALQLNAWQDGLPLYDKRYLATDLITVRIPVTQTLSKKQRKQGKKIRQVQQIQPLHGFAENEFPVLIPADNLSDNRSRLREQIE